MLVYRRVSLCIFSWLVWFQVVQHFRHEPTTCRNLQWCSSQIDPFKWTKGWGRNKALRAANPRGRDCGLVASDGFGSLYRIVEMNCLNVTVLTARERTCQIPILFLGIFEILVDASNKITWILAACQQSWCMLMQSNTWPGHETLQFKPGWVVSLLLLDWRSKRLKTNDIIWSQTSRGDGRIHMQPLTVPTPLEKYAWIPCGRIQLHMEGGCTSFPLPSLILSTTWGANSKCKRSRAGPCPEPVIPADTKNPTRPLGGPQLILPAWLALAKTLRSENWPWMSMAQPQQPMLKKSSFEIPKKSSKLQTSPTIFFSGKNKRFPRTTSLRLGNLSNNVKQGRFIILSQSLWPCIFTMNTQESDPALSKAGAISSCILHQMTPAHHNSSYGDGSKPWYLVNPKIAGKWMFIPLKIVSIGIDPYPYHPQFTLQS